MSVEAIEFRDLKKQFGTVAAVNSVSIRVAKGEFFSLLGPSGCGKSTLLRLVAGLEHPDAGELFILGRSMSGVPPQKRPVNTVFQSYALFPHLNVFDNVAFGLRMQKTDRDQLQRRVNSALELTHVSELRDRIPAQISGGQKQRVALARALVNEPAVLLLDEPLAAVDAKLRAQLQNDLKALQRQLGITFLYVTHDQDEAISLSDRVAVMQAGRIEQIGTPEEIYTRPRNRFVAAFVGAANIIRGRVLSQSDNSATVETEIGTLHLSASPGVNQNPSLAIRRERILLEPEGEQNVVAGRIANISFVGAQTQYSVTVNGTILEVVISNSRCLTRTLRTGDTIKLFLPPEALVLMDDK
jgi:spermidine/putrescine transport system ATP-binding protein